MYEKLAGMMAPHSPRPVSSRRSTGWRCADPTNMPMIRGDQRDLIYRTEEAKFEAIVEDVAERS